MLADKFVEGAKAAGNDVEKISLIGKEIQFCKGCFGCQKLGRCVIKDDVNDIMAKVLEADVVCWATPIYYYEMSGQMKTMLDRGNPLFTTDYAFRDVYFLSTAADTDAEAAERAKNGLEGWIECFPKARLAGSVFGGGVTGTDEMQGKSAMEEAYEMGKGV